MSTEGKTCASVWDEGARNPQLEIDMPAMSDGASLVLLYVSTRRRITAAS